MSVRVLLVDDQRVVRDGLALLLGLLPDVELVGTAADGQEAVDMVAEHQPDVVLMDLRMPRMDGIAATAAIRRGHPGVNVIVLTTYADDESVFGALRAGARGYLTKDAGAEDIAGAIAAVDRGDALLNPAVQARLLDHLDSAPPAPTPPAPALPDGLTAREAEVLRLIAAGHSNAEIAAELFISEATVKTHINHVWRKTGVRDRAQAVTYAYRTGLAAT